MTDLALHLAVGGTFLIAGLVKGISGMGLPTVAMGLLGLVLAPAQAASLLVVPSLVTNLWQLAAGPRIGGLLRRLWPMLAGILLGTPATAGVLAGDAAAGAGTALGAVLMCYAALGLLRVRPRVPGRAEAWLTGPVGLLTGLITGMTGVFVMPAVPFLQALDLDREELVQALGLSFTVSTVALAFGLAVHGAFRLPGADPAHLALPLAAALAGMALGGWLRRRIPPALFRLCFFLCLLALGADLALRG